jgi:hypothetical protein
VGSVKLVAEVTVILPGKNMDDEFQKGKRFGTEIP